MDQATAIPVGESSALPLRADSLARHRADTIVRLRTDTTIRSRTDTAVLTGADTTAFLTPDSTAQVWFAADSLGLLFRGSTDTLFRSTKNPDEIFGTASIITRPRITPSRTDYPLTDNAVFQGFVLLLAAIYMLLLYRHLGDVLSLLSRISRSPASGERLTDDQGGIAFSRFLNITAAIGMLFTGIIVVKTCETRIPPDLTQLLPQSAVLTMSLAVAIAASLIGAYQILVVRLSGAITLSQAITSQLIYLKRTYFALAVIVTSPVLLLYALCPIEKGQVWFYTILTLLAITALLYLKETLKLFLSKKVSILHWFLYLCAIEIFPISLFVLMAVR